MMQLHKSLLVTPHPDQTPASYCSQVAFKLGRGANEFCLDMGLRFKEIVDGDPSAVARLEHLCTLPQGYFERSTIRSTGSREFEIAGHLFPREMLSRSEIRVCPFCLEEDGSGQDGAYGLYGRISWLLTPVRRCDRHGSLLVALYPNEKPRHANDVSPLLRLDPQRLDKLKAEAVPCSPSDLSAYVVQAIAGERTQPAPFALPLYAVAKLAEATGAILAFGAHRGWSSLSNEEWHRAGHEGFAAIRDGERRFRETLHSLQEKHIERREILGARSTFGRLYEFLAADNADPAYDLVREVMRDHILSNMTYGTGDIIFGKPVEQRKLHSVTTAAAETGLHPKRLRKLLFAANVVPAEHQDRLNDHILIDVESSKPFLEKLQGALTLKEAAAYLNLPRPNDRILARAAILPAIVPFETPGLQHGCFDKTDIDNFLKMLTRSATVAQPSDQNFYSILDASRRACCGVVEVVRLILSGNLQDLRLDQTERGFMSVLVSIEELKPFVRLPDHGGVPVFAAQKRLKTTHKVIEALIDLGHIPFHFELNPVNRGRHRYVQQADIQTFQQTYVSLHAYAEEVGMHFLPVKKAIVSAGIAEAFDRQKVKATFYRRSDLTTLQLT